MSFIEFYKKIVPSSDIFLSPPVTASKAQGSQTFSADFKGPAVQIHYGHSVTSTEGQLWPGTGPAWWLRAQSCLSPSHLAPSLHSSSCGPWLPSSQQIHLRKSALLSSQPLSAVTLALSSWHSTPTSIHSLGAAIGLAVISRTSVLSAPPALGRPVSVTTTSLRQTQLLTSQKS